MGEARGRGGQFNSAVWACDTFFLPLSQLETQVHADTLQRHIQSNVEGRKQEAELRTKCENIRRQLRGLKVA